MAVHRCLLMREFQRRRRLVDREICLREGCERVRSVEQVLWECKYVKGVWKRLGKSGVDNGVVHTVLHTLTPTFYGWREVGSFFV